MHMTRWMMMAVLVAGCAAFGPAVNAQEVQSGIVFVDLDSVFTNYHKTRAAEAQLKEQADEIKAERKVLIEQLEKAQADYQALRTQAQSTALNEDARNQRRAEAEEKLIEVRDMETKIRRLEETAQRRIDEQSRRARKRLVDEINGIIREYAMTRGYQAIIDTSGESLNGVPTVVFYNPKFDITSEIITLVNSKR
ncbi:MAG TPA: OmpH family outer membrane protein [Kiritimatiellia bacterium]|nr:OmpH family outer membrane protein [Kiritimatiellia bacterium]HMO98862.1 OmpH family outer membrane protein [Kiritimatiellia bacterium]